jgi:hypothetical protein
MQAEAQNLCGYLSLGGLASLLSRGLVLVPFTWLWRWERQL